MSGRGWGYGCGRDQVEDLGGAAVRRRSRFRAVGRRGLLLQRRIVGRGALCGSLLVAPLSVCVRVCPVHDLPSPILAMVVLVNPGNRPGDSMRATAAAGVAVERRWTRGSSRDSCYTLHPRTAGTEFEHEHGARRQRVRKPKAKRRRLGRVLIRCQPTRCHAALPCPGPALHSPERAALHLPLERPACSLPPPDCDTASHLFINGYFVISAARLARASR